MVNKRVWNAVILCNLKKDIIISVHFQGKLFYITVIQVYVPISNAEEAEVEWFYNDLPYLLELTPKNRCPFHHKGLECKSRKSRVNWSNRQGWPWSTKWSRTKANSVLPRECTGYSKHPLPTAQERIYTWTSLECLCVILWNSAFRWIHLFFSPLPFTFLFSAICEVSSDNHFAFFHFLLWYGLKYIQ